jgi:hypothetical protein
MSPKVPPALAGKMLAVLCVAGWLWHSTAAVAQTEPSMLYVGTLDASKPRLGAGEHYSLHEYRADGNETVLAYLHSSEVDAYLALVDQSGNVLLAVDDGAGTGTDAWFVVELEPGDYTFVVTTAFAGEEGAWRLFVASGVAPGGEIDGAVEPGHLVIHGGVPAEVHLVAGKAGEGIDLAVDSDSFDATLLIAAPDGTSSAADDDVGTNPRLRYVFPEDGIYPVFVGSFDGRTGDYRANFEVRASAEEPRDDDFGREETEAAVPLVGNTWIYQTMSFPSAFGGLTNEFVSGHLTLFPAGRYEMLLRIGDFVNRYSGAYAVDGDRLSLQGYGDVRFAQSGFRATFWDGAGSIYGLALEGSCEGGVCALR